MASKERLNSILGKLREQASLAPDEVAELQSHIDQLENEVTLEASFHHTSSSPGSHYTNHETSVSDVMGFLDRATRKD